MNDANVGAMNLPATGQRPAAFEQFEESPAILVNVFGVVFIESGEVQRVFQHRADTAHPGREGVNETVIFQRGANQAAHALAFAPVETGVFQSRFSCDHFYRN
jgi:hypothetical protein